MTTPNLELVEAEHRLRSVQFAVQVRRWATEQATMWAMVKEQCRALQVMVQSAARLHRGTLVGVDLVAEQRDLFPSPEVAEQAEQLRAEVERALLETDSAMVLAQAALASARDLVLETVQAQDQAWEQALESAAARRAAGAEELSPGQVVEVSFSAASFL
jgi:hypothetical protein